MGYRDRRMLRHKVLVEAQAALREIWSRSREKF
jgi:hypothetical protein